MRILLIEDEKKIADAIKRGLEKQAYAVDVVYDGQAGMGRAVGGKYDLLILDRMLPGVKDGLEICRAMRAEGRHEPILMLTARDATTDRIDGLDAGADDYLIKPFSFDELVARIRALFRRPEPVIGTVLRVRDLELNPKTADVRRQGKAISLSRKELSLLEYLMRNKGLVVSKDQLIAHVWDFDADILPNTVEAFIKSLRDKVERPFGGAPLIETVRGFGYRLCA